MTIEIGILFTIIGGFIGILSFLMNRDKKIINDSKWRGSVDTKLDMILGIKDDIKEVSRKLDAHIKEAEGTIQDHEKRIYYLEQIKKE